VPTVVVAEDEEVNFLVRPRDNRSTKIMPNTHTTKIAMKIERTHAGAMVRYIFYGRCRL
jgi:hypothetical protein